MARTSIQDLFGGRSNATASRASGSQIGSAVSANRIDTLTSDPGAGPGGKRRNVNRALGAGLQEAARITEETDARRDDQLALLNDEQGRASQPTITDSDIERMHSQQTDRLGHESNALVKNLREYLGGSNIQGGAAMDLAGQVEIQRMAQERDSRRDLMIFRANADATDRLNRWARAFQIGDVVGREPSPFLSDAIQSLAGVRLTQQGLGVAFNTAQMQAEAAADAGEQSMFGSLAGGVLGIAGSALFG